MFRKALAPLFIVGALFATTVPSHAAVVCGDRTELIGALSGDYNEQPAYEALTTDGRLMEVLTSETGTWTVLLTTPSGKTCVIAAGTSWESLRNARLTPNA